MEPDVKAHVLCLGNTPAANYSALLALEPNGAFTFSQSGESPETRFYLIVLVSRSLEDVARRYLGTIQDFLELLGPRNLELVLLEVNDENDPRKAYEALLSKLQELGEIRELIVNVTTGSKAMIAGSLLATVRYAESRKDTRIRICYLGSGYRELDRGVAYALLRTYWFEL